MIIFEAIKDWHPASIVAEGHIRRVTLRQLLIDAGLKKIQKKCYLQ